MNTTTTFESAKVGDRVWSVECGWGKIRSTSHSDAHPLLIVFDENKYISFKLNGSRLHWCKNQTLFWDEVKIEAPTKPLADLEVDTKVLVWGVPDRKYKRHFSHFEDGKIYTFDNGSTSFTMLHKKSVTGWSNWELVE